jgi:hypothetical protein
MIGRGGVLRLIAPIEVRTQDARHPGHTNEKTAASGLADTVGANVLNTDRATL